MSKIALLCLLVCFQANASPESTGPDAGPDAAYGWNHSTVPIKRLFDKADPVARYEIGAGADPDGTTSFSTTGRTTLGNDDTRTGGPVPVVRIGVSYAIPPWVIPEQNAGIELDILHKALEPYGIRVKAVYVPYARAFALYRSGAVDAVLNVRPGDDQDGHVSEVLATFRNVAVSLAANGHPGELPFAELAKYRVVAFQRARKALGEAFSDAVENNPNYREIADQSLQINLLFLRGVEFVVLEEKIFNYFRQHALLQYQSIEATARRFSQPVTIHRIFDATPYRVLFRSKAMRDHFDRGLARLNETGEVEAIHARYGSLAVAGKGSVQNAAR